MKPKKSLSTETFIYLAATDAKFRTRYFKDPSLLEKNFDISKKDLSKILRIDFAGLRKELPGIKGKIAALGNIKASCHDSHSYHESGTHSSGTHNNDCGMDFNKAVQKEIARLVR